MLPLPHDILPSDKALYDARAFRCISTVIRLAEDIKLLDILHHRPWQIDELVTHLGATRRGIDAVLAVLASLEFISIAGTNVTGTPSGFAYLRPSSPFFTLFAPESPEALE